MRAPPYRKIPDFLIEEKEYWEKLDYLVRKDVTSLWEEMVERIRYSEDYEKIEQKLKSLSEYITKIKYFN
jgi:hypothetical protein